MYLDLFLPKEKCYICKGVYCNRLRHRPAPTGIVGTVKDKHVFVIDKKILDELTAKAKENSRLRCNDMVPGGVVLNIEKGQWHSLKCLESGTVLFEAKDGGDQPLSPEDIMEV